ncbi:MAG: radical SAM protein [Ignavibacteriaceae bacterium]|nr:radical SAM protein [Ignavibacteriaceae bacterium]
MIKVLLVIPPFIQMNAPYPSVMQLSGFLKSKGYSAGSYDLSLNVFLRIFCSDFLKKMFESLDPANLKDENSIRIFALRNSYIEIIDSVINYLQGKQPELAYQLSKKQFLPVSDFFYEAESAEYANLQGKGIEALARFYSTLIIDELAIFIQKNVNQHFGLGRYAEKLSQSLPEFEPLKKELEKPSDLIVDVINDETIKMIGNSDFTIAGFTIPFPGNLLGALISAKKIKSIYPGVKIVFGGGYVNTELRNLSDPGIFDYCDFITFDDGEIPLLNIIRSVEGNDTGFVRTMIRVDGKVKYIDEGLTKITDFKNSPPNDLTGIDPSEYVSMTETTNPVHYLWSSGFWNKMTLAHGCYWKKCTFCDISLDYIGRYNGGNAKSLVDNMEFLIRQTGRTAFHFTDEAAPPALLKELAIQIISRKLKVTWWGNIRFDDAFTPGLTKLLSLSGCIALTGGIEVAEERLLKLIEKGVTIRGVTNVLKNFSNSGILVHAYLMYGFPTQNEQELINSLEVVRQLFSYELLKSAFWHRFSLTVHSPVAKNPEKYGVTILSSLNYPFANNDLRFTSDVDIDYVKYSNGLKLAIQHYMRGEGILEKVNYWFDFNTPKTTVDKKLISKFLNEAINQDIKPEKRFYYTGGEPLVVQIKRRKIIKIHNSSFVAEYNHTEHLELIFEYFFEISRGEKFPYVKNVIEGFPGGNEAFVEFTGTDVWNELRENYILII